MNSEAHIKDCYLAAFGTRPEVIKLAPVVHALRKSGAEVRLCNTEQQKEMSFEALETFGLSSDFRGDTMTQSQSLFEITTRTLQFFEDCLEKTNPIAMIVQGDTTTTMTGALSAFYKQVPVVHVEAGLRSFRKDAPFPEEVNRAMVTQIADLHFAPARQAEANLLASGVKQEAISVVGNTVLDAFKFAVAQEPTKVAQEVFESAKGRAIVPFTFHRRENLELIEKVFESLSELAKKHTNIYFFVPVHPRPVIKSMAEKWFSDIENIVRSDFIDYLSMAQLLSRAHCVITDSGGLQEEALCAEKPVLILRETTERPEVVESGNGVLIGHDMKKLHSMFDELAKPSSELLKRMSQKSTLLGDGTAGKKIADQILARYSS